MCGGGGKRAERRRSKQGSDMGWGKTLMASAATSEKMSKLNFSGILWGDGSFSCVGVSTRAGTGPNESSGGVTQYCCLLTS